MKRRAWFSSAVLGTLAALALVAAPAHAALDKCQKELEVRGRFYQDQVLKALQFCKDAYRIEYVKAITKGLTSQQFLLALDKKAPVCGKKLFGVLGVPNGLGAVVQTTQAEKIFKKLSDAVTTGKCTDNDLASLGHLPSVYGDAWKRLFLTAMLKAAYEKQLALVHDFPGILSTMIDPDNMNPGDCSAGLSPNFCQLLQSPPCFNRTCRLASGSESNTNIGFPINIPLQGELTTGYCQFDPFLGSDIGVIGGPSRTTDPVAVLPLADACPSTLRASGFIKCGSNPTMSGPINTRVCAKADGGGPNGICTGMIAPVCAPQPPGIGNNTNCGVPPGPNCVEASGPTAGQGDAVVLSVLQIETQQPPATPPGSTCTGVGGNVVPVLFTTGTATVEVENGGASCGGIGPFSKTGSSFANLCPTTPGFFHSGTLAGGSLVGGFVATSPTSTLGDLTSVNGFICQ